MWKEARKHIIRYLGLWRQVRKPQRSPAMSPGPAPPTPTGACRLERLMQTVKVTPGAVVCLEADYFGEITIGSRTVIHPKARIIAEAGPIIIGEGNLIEEQAQIIHRLPEGSEPQDPPPVMIIGNNNVFEVDSYCQASKIGDNNILEAKSHIGWGVELTRGCVIGSLCSLVCPQTVPENTVIYGDELHRRSQAEKPASQGLQLDFLTKILPNYHHLIKPRKKVAA